MLRGTKSGLEFVFTGETFDQAVSELAERLDGRPGFYRGSRATAMFVDSLPSGEALWRFLEAVRGWGIELRGVYGAEGLSTLADEFGLEYLGVPPQPAVASFERKRAARAERELALTERARSLDADFDGARAEIARRRARGEASVRRPDFTAPKTKAAAAAPPQPAPVAELPSTLYHRGTVRGGQSLQQLGNIVVAGDVNPGAELVASGDILVFGALRGTAHAGAQGDASAKVFALELAPTQLRIATFIAADEHGRTSSEPEVAFVKDDGIAIAPQARKGSSA
jgi:septum site-determining protein MinC